MNEWPTRKKKSSKIGKIRYNPNKSHEDLNHLKLYKKGASPPQGTHSLTLFTVFDLESHNHITGLLELFISTLISFSAIVLGYAEELVTEGTPSNLEHCGLCWGSERKMEGEIPINNEEGDESSQPQPTPEKEVNQRNQTIQQLEAALRELLERQTREAAIASEVVKRAEELAKRQQAVLDEAERRETSSNSFRLSRHSSLHHSLILIIKSSSTLSFISFSSSFIFKVHPRFN
ncbi:hypothetical protein PIB30_046257 [Stylosanthes scabra]|uniref:Uncharacterized protein n=1 Tax=Stylosanthes scabra TaxID=79078 RepID=A0ABU6WHI0_9FABA|nr:hypothetical protein [Stylosanthes scabra]